MSIDFPQGEPGDGDGLSELGVTNLHGLFIGDTAVPNTPETLSFRHMYPSSLQYLRVDQFQLLKGEAG